MKKFSLKSGMSGVCLITIILLSSMFSSVNVFSGLHWQKSFMDIKCDHHKKIITIVFLFYDNTYGFLADGFLEHCTFDYSEDGLSYNSILMRVKTNRQKNIEFSRITMYCKQRGQQIRILNCVKPKVGTVIWFDVIKEMDVEVNVQEGINRSGSFWISTNRAWITIEWQLPSSKCIKTIRTHGSWKVLGNRKSDLIKEIYPIEIVKSNSKMIKNTPSELNSVTNHNVKVTGESDAITVSGADTGVNINVYNASGVELKSVIANDDVVNFKLLKNQIYTVKVGTKSYKVAL